MCQPYGHQPPVTRLCEVFGEVSNTGKENLEDKVVDLNVVEESARVTNKDRELTVIMGVEKLFNQPKHRLVDLSY